MGQQRRRGARPSRAGSVSQYVRWAKSRKAATSPMVALVGDGGFAMTATELRIAAELRLPVVVVVFADWSLNRIELRQQVRGYPPTATRMGGTDLPVLAEAMGCDGVRAETRAALEKALAGLATRFAGARPLLVEARIDPSQYEAQF